MKTHQDYPFKGAPENLIIPNRGKLSTFLRTPNFKFAETPAPTVNVVWSPECVPEHVESYSPSWKKPRDFMDQLQWLGLLEKVPVIPADPATLEELSSVHHPKYVKGVLDGTLRDGFGNMGEASAKSYLYTCGMFASAAQWAADTQASYCVPVSGFHHAEYDNGGGFCTFNGLMLAAHRVLAQGKTPGILDLDFHYANGTVNIMGKKNWNFPHFTMGASICYSENRGAGKNFLHKLRTTLAEDFSNVDVLLYQAGADAHRDDPLGGILTTSQMAQRDQIVFEFAKAQNIPVVWNLAGGYQSPLSKVVDLHVTTYRTFLEYLC